MGEEAGAEIYDQMYSEDTYAPAALYYPLFQRIVNEIQKRNVRSVLEVGCGSGRLAQLLLTRTNVSYHGFDFSASGVKSAIERTGKDSMFFVGDALSANSYNFNYDGIACTEVLEHIERDLDVMNLWRAGTQCICSVPNFDDPTHVRHFLNEGEVNERYGRLLDITEIIRIPRPLLAGRTLGQYFQTLRWSRNNPKRVLGMMGINTFDWYAGWFLFIGTRRT